jgi:hypothetical protein
VPDPFALTCDWIDLCDSTGYAMVAHPDKGVIPACKYHCDAFRLPTITLLEQDH